MTEKDVQIIWKAWGQEILLHNGPEYIYKRLHIKAGTRTSLQRHKYKFETNYIISGKAEIWLEDETTHEIKKTIMGENEFFTVKPPLIHRVVAITDLVLQECSTSHIDDCERLSDDYNRTHGRIDAEWMTPAFCILAAGKGERVSKVMRGLHKGLLKVEDKAAISHIIDKVPINVEIVIALGFNANILKDYVSCAHSDRKITFVKVDDYESEDSGPGKSIRAAKELLQRPFYFCVVDCLFKGELPLIDGNWIGIHPTDIPELYSTAKLDEQNNVTDFKNKSSSGYENAFIGLACVRDYVAFWANLGENKEIVSAFENTTNFPLKAKAIDWDDIGTIDGYSKLRKSSSLQKTTEEENYLINGRFIKLNSSIGITRDRVKRAGNLKGLAPKITSYFDHCLSYDYVEGKTLYEMDKVEAYKKFIDFLHLTFSVDFPQQIDGQGLAKKFYIDKTRDRLVKFYEQNADFTVGSLTINGQITQNETASFLNQLDSLTESPQFSELFHGDLQPDNIIYNDKSETFSLIDWRSDFGGSTLGDRYYDLAKLYCGLSFSWHLSKNVANFNYSKTGDDISYSIPQTQAMKLALDYFVQKFGKDYDMYKIKKLATLIKFNMSPLHLFPMNHVLYCQGLLEHNA